MKDRSFIFQENEILKERIKRLDEHLAELMKKLEQQREKKNEKL